MLRTGGSDRRIPLGRGQWARSRVALAIFPEQPAAASGGWTGDDTYTARICLTETPFLFKLTLRFSGNEVQLDREANVGFGPTRQPRLVGKAD